MAPEAQAGQRYASQVGELWSGLSRTLVRIEALAGAPERLAEDDELRELRRLQYRLHAAAEDAVGISPPVGSEELHAELAEALEDARDLTGELVAAAELEGADALSPRIYEWRGALFRVRLARLRLSTATATTSDAAAPVEAPEEDPPGIAAPLGALALSLGGTTAFLVGATVGPWALWIVGAIALCLSLVVYRP